MMDGGQPKIGQSLFLCEVYLEVMFPKDRASLRSSSEKYNCVDQDFIRWAFVY